MKADTQVLFSDDWLKRINSPIITTGNELQGEEIIEFSKQLNVHALLEYCQEVMRSTNEILQNLEYRDLKNTFEDEDRKRLIDSQCISTDESEFWLIDYWCGKDIRGLIQMPFSRHWIMHVEAMCRIKNRLCQKARKGTDPIAYCGLSCNHCFLKDWCGSCRTSYNTCSFAACSPDGICPNAECCREKGLDGCYECEELDSCTKGFYETGTDGNAVKAMAMFIRKYGKWELPPVLKTLHEKYEFKKIQEVIGYNTLEGLTILEANRRNSDQ